MKDNETVVRFCLVPKILADRSLTMVIKQDNIKTFENNYRECI